MLTSIGYAIPSLRGHMTDALYVPKDGPRLKPTGAFEVYYNDELIYSKLKTGVMPEPEDVIKILKEKIKN